MFDLKLKSFFMMFLMCRHFELKLTIFFNRSMYKFLDSIELSHFFLYNSTTINLKFVFIFIFVSVENVVHIFFSIYYIFVKTFFNFHDNFFRLIFLKIIVCFCSQCFNVCDKLNEYDDFFNRFVHRLSFL